MNHFLMGIFMSASLLLTLFSANAAETNAIEGTLSIEVEDYADHAQLRYWLKDKQGKRTEVLLEKQPSWLKTGQTLRVHGNPQGKKFVVENESISLLQTNESTSELSADISPSSVMDSVTGTKTILAAEVNFAVNPIVKFTTADIHDIDRKSTRLNSSH